MSNFVEVIAIVEGETEQIFIRELLAPLLAQKQIFMTASQVGEPEGKGGDIRFDRVKRNIEVQLKQRDDTYVTTLVDYYGARKWPGKDQVPKNASPEVIAQTVNDATQAAVTQLFPEQHVARRFIPHMAIHEFEALLFSDSAILAKELGVKPKEVEAVLSQCGEPEAINNRPQTAPSKRLDKWWRQKSNKSRKKTTGVDIAKLIGIEKMRAQCPVFDQWLQRLENTLSERIPKLQ